FPPAYTALLQSAPPQHQYPGSAEWRGVLPTPCVPHSLPSLVQFPHSPPLSHHRGGTPSAAGPPDARPSPFPLPQTPPELQSPSWASHLLPLGQNLHSRFSPFKHIHGV